MGLGLVLGGAVTLAAWPVNGTKLGAQAEARGQVSGRPVRGFARLAWAHYPMRH